VQDDEAKELVSVWGERVIDALAGEALVKITRQLHAAVSTMVHSLVLIRQGEPKHAENALGSFLMSFDAALAAKIGLKQENESERGSRQAAPEMDSENDCGRGGASDSSG
jgi:hypothetical protein